MESRVQRRALSPGERKKSGYDFLGTKNRKNRRPRLKDMRSGLLFQSCTVNWSVALAAFCLYYGKHITAILQYRSKEAVTSFLKNRKLTSTWFHSHCSRSPRCIVVALGNVKLTGLPPMVTQLSRTGRPLLVRLSYWHRDLTLSGEITTWTLFKSKNKCFIRSSI